MGNTRELGSPSTLVVLAIISDLVPLLKLIYMRGGIGEILPAQECKVQPRLANVYDSIIHQSGRMLEVACVPAEWRKRAHAR